MRLTLISCLLVTYSVVGCLEQKETDRRNIQNQIEVVKEFVDAITVQDIETMSSLMADDFVQKGPYFDSTYTREETIALWKDNFSKAEQIKFDRDHILYEQIPEGELKGNWVMDWGAVTEIFKNMPDTAVFDVHTVYKVENRKISMAHLFYNEADIQKQLGYKFQDPDLK